jgi:hypothetical protein
MRICFIPRHFRKSTVSWDVTPYSVVEFFRRFGGTYCPCLQHRRVNKTSNESPCLPFTYFAYSVASSETLISFYHTTRHHITEDSTSHNYRREKLKP